MQTRGHEAGGGFVSGEARSPCFPSSLPGSVFRASCSAPYPEPPAPPLPAPAPRRLEGPPQMQRGPARLALWAAWPQDSLGHGFCSRRIGARECRELVTVPRHRIGLLSPRLGCEGIPAPGLREIVKKRVGAASSNCKLSFQGISPHDCFHWGFVYTWSAKSKIHGHRVKNCDSFRGHVAKKNHRKMRARE